MRDRRITEGEIEEMNRFLESLKVEQVERQLAGFRLLSLGKGSERIVRVLDEVAVRRNVHFRGSKRQPVICPGRSCSLCSGGNRALACCYFNVYDHADGLVKVMCVFGKLLEMLTAVVQREEDTPQPYDIVVGQKIGGGYFLGKSAAPRPIPEGLSRYPLEQLLKPMSAIEKGGQSSIDDGAPV